MLSMMLRAISPPPSMLFDKITASFSS